MAYHRYITEGIVLTSVGKGERDVLCTILTYDLGSIYASARSARLPISKMKQGIQESSISQFSFIRGSYGWKIVGVKNTSQPFFELKERPDAKRVFARILRFIKTSVSGEEQHPELFQIVHEAYVTLTSTSYTKEELFLIECITILRILNELGHVPNRSEYSFFDSHIITVDMIRDLKLHKSQIVSDINQVLASGVL